MKRFALPALISLLFLAGCATVSHRDRAILQADGVPQYLYDKMLYGDPLSPADVIILSTRGVPPGLIVNYMDTSDSMYHLSKAEVRKLRNAGVSDQVIAYMLSTAPPYGSYAYEGYPYPYPYDYYGLPYGYDYGPFFYGWGGWGHRGWGRGGGWGHGGGWGGHGGGGHGGGHGR